jgi:hypothetical protein
MLAGSEQVLCRALEETVEVSAICQPFLWV